MRLLLGLTVALLVGCASSTADEENPFSAGFDPIGGAVDLHVDNINFQDATVTAIHQGGRQRLGVVGGKTSRSFHFEWPSTRDIRLHIDLLASVNYLTPPMSVSPGDVLRLHIDTVLNRSHLSR